MDKQHHWATLTISSPVLCLARSARGRQRRAIGRILIVMVIAALVIVASVSVVFLLKGGQRVAGPAFTRVDFPGAADTIATGINQFGTIVGDYRNTSYGEIQGFMLSGGVFTKIECPGAGFTRPTGINDNNSVVGYCTTDLDHGFLLVNGVYRLFDFPGSVATEGLGINKAGDIVGDYCHQGCHGFLLKAGEFTSIDFPGATTTEAWRINDFGEILGSFTWSDGARHLYELTNGTFKSGPDFPGAVATAFGPTFIAGLNNHGDIASDYCSLAPCPPSPSDLFNSHMTDHGFTLSQGKFATLDFPGAVATGCFGINDAGQVAGVFFGQDEHEHGFLWTP